MEKFYYHNDGCDNNGNNGPCACTGGWICVEAESANEALKALPKQAQAKITNFMKKMQADYPSETLYDYTDLFDCMCASCGWGVGFSFMGEPDWDNLLEECEECCS